MTESPMLGDPVEVIQMSLENKRQLIEKYRDRFEQQTAKRREVAPKSSVQLKARIDDFTVGKFLNIDAINIRWMDEQLFEYKPNDDRPFAFERHTGEVITPGWMYTDGGTIPWWARWKEGLRPWQYGPVYLIHDWEFDVHHCGHSQKSFEEVSITMMEALKTLMETKELAKRDEWVFWAIDEAITSDTAREMWNEPGCTLPEAHDRMS